MAEHAEYTASIDIDASPGAVFEYLTTPAGLTAWMGTYAELEPHPDGRFAVDIAGYPIRGRYLHVDRPRRVVVSWGVDGSPDLPPGASTVEFTLTPTESGTRVDLRHAGLPKPQLNGHANGWAHFLPRLRVAAVSADAGPDDWRPLSTTTASHPTSTINDEGALMTRHSAAEVVQAYHQAWTSGDVDKAMTWVADDVVCRAPGQELTGKEAYRRFLAGFAPSLTGVNDIASFADSGRVALFYYPCTVATSTAPAAECFTVRGTKIVENVLVFDRLSFSPPAAG